MLSTQIVDKNSVTCGPPLHFIEGNWDAERVKFYYPLSWNGDKYHILQVMEWSCCRKLKLGF